MVVTSDYGDRERWEKLVLMSERLASSHTLKSAVDLSVRVG